MNVLKQKFGLVLFLIALAIMDTATLQGQSANGMSFAEKQFYGNRIQAGSILLSGSIQASAYDDPNIDGGIGMAGLGVGVGFSEVFAFTASYSHAKVQDGFLGTDIETNAISLGLRFLPNTVAGFVQPYLGLDYLRVTNKGASDLVTQGAVIPMGFIFWISHFMALSVQAFSISMQGLTGEDIDYEPVFDFNLNLTNPTFSINFLINGQRP